MLVLLVFLLGLHRRSIDLDRGINYEPGPDHILAFVRKKRGRI